MTLSESRRGHLSVLALAAALGLGGTRVLALPTEAGPYTGKPGVEQAQERKRLEAAVDEYVKKMRRVGRISSDERTAWSVYDFSTGKTLVEINADLELQAASLIKPFVALAFMSQVADGKRVYDNENQEILRRMIQNSDNAATD